MVQIKLRDFIACHIAGIRHANSNLYIHVAAGLVRSHGKRVVPEARITQPMAEWEQRAAVTVDIFVCFGWIEVIEVRELTDASRE
jgi:hypothetical protein